MKHEDDEVSVTAGAETRGLSAFATGRPTSPKSKSKSKTVTRGLLSSVRATERKTRITEDYARDEFGELGPRKRGAASICRQLGHQMGAWRRRPNDVAGRWNAYCLDCNKIVTVCTEPAEGLPMVYGSATTEPCR